MSVVSINAPSGSKPNGSRPIDSRFIKHPATEQFRSFVEEIGDENLGKEFAGLHSDTKVNQRVSIELPVHRPVDAYTLVNLRVG
ncbi:MAG: hypothetical protein OEU84_12620, partial [Xanthomonadales bacterium]|nr:hypothetical protein [Xanthomonadales bacterium]